MNIKSQLETFENTVRKEVDAKLVEFRNKILKETFVPTFKKGDRLVLGTNILSIHDSYRLRTVKNDSYMSGCFELVNVISDDGIESNGQAVQNYTKVTETKTVFVPKIKKGTKLQMKNNGGYRTSTSDSYILKENSPFAKKGEEVIDVAYKVTGCPDEKLSGVPICWYNVIPFTPKFKKGDFVLIDFERALLALGDSHLSNGEELVLTRNGSYLAGLCKLLVVKE